MKYLSPASVVTALGLSAAVFAAGAQAQEISIWTPTKSAEASTNAMNTVIAEFEAANPGTKVTWTTRGVDDHKKALRVAAGADSGPDIYFNWAGLGLGGEYVLAGMSEPLDRYYDQYGWSDRLVPSAEAFVDLYPGGKHGVPESFRGEVLYYNTELFAEAGITEVPSSYDELLAAAEKLKESGIPAITFGGTVNWHVMRLMDVLLETKCGADDHDALIGMSLNWSETDCAVAAFTELKTWADNYFLKPFMGIDYNQSFDLFAAGRAAMMLEGNWLVNKVYEAGIENSVKLFPFPTGTDRLYGFGQVFYVSSKSKNKDLAAKFLDYLLSTDVQQRFTGDFGGIKINSEVELTDLRPLEQDWQDIFARYSSMFINGDQGFPAQIVPEYFRVINEVVTDNMQPQEAADALQAFIELNKG